jgi:hypothetical protein
MDNRPATQSAQSADLTAQLAAHLTDEQFSDLLLGAGAPAVQAHLKACSQCAEEAERVSAAIGSFEQQSRLWAERRAASHSVLVPRRQSAFAWLHIPTTPQAWTAAAAAVALAVGVGVSVRDGFNFSDRRAPSVQTTSMHASVAQTAAVQAPIAGVQPAAQVSPATGVSPTTLKADNDLLSAIDGELRADESTPASLYGLDTYGPDTAAHGARLRPAKRISE